MTDQAQLRVAQAILHADPNLLGPWKDAAPSHRAKALALAHAAITAYEEGPGWK